MTINIYIIISNTIYIQYIITGIGRGRGGRATETEKGGLGKNVELANLCSSATTRPVFHCPHALIYRETRSSSDARVKEEPRREDRGGEPRREERSDSHRERR